MKVIIVGQWLAEPPARRGCAGSTKKPKSCWSSVARTYHTRNCGLPYHVGGVIEKESSLLVASEQLFRERFAIDVQTSSEAIGISPKEKKVKLRSVTTGEVTEHAYDKLVLSPGAVSIRPPLPGIDLPGIFQVRTVPDARQIKEWIKERHNGERRMRAVVVGGGFIGVEMAENLVHLGIEVTLVEMASQVLPPVDAEFARLAEARLKHHGVRLAFGDGVAAFEKVQDGSIDVRTKSGNAHRGDLVIFARRASGYGSRQSGRASTRRARRNSRR